MYRLAYNTTDSALVVDPSGRLLDGRTHGPVDDVFDEVDAAIGRGDLHVVSDTAHLAQVTEQADLVVELNDRRAALLAATPSDLRALAELRGLPSDEQTPTALAAMLAPTGASLDELVEDTDEQEA